MSVKTTLEINGHEVVVSTTEDGFTVTVTKDGEELNFFEVGESQSEESEESEESGNDEVQGFDEFDQEDRDEDNDGMDDDIQDDMEDDMEDSLESDGINTPKMESFTEFLNRKK